MGQKNAELVSLDGTFDEPLCLTKARAVFQGNNTQLGDGSPAYLLFQEVGATPSSYATAKCAMGVRVLKRARTTTRDAQQAYIQSYIDGPGRPRTWVRLPRAWWPKSWFNADGSPKYHDPVCVLKKFL